MFTPPLLNIERTDELSVIKQFIMKPGVGFLYVRGRRRVGKSWLLFQTKDQLQKQHIFLFAGTPDVSPHKALTRFAAEWEIFSKTSVLSSLRSPYLTWDRVFSEVTAYAATLPKPLILVLDEIQWIAGTRSGMIGALKHAWLEWEMKQLVKVIVCGSSNRFFSTMAGGEEQILRGLQTHATLWVNPVPLSIVRKQLFPTWSLQQVCLTYMMFGGMPYYLNQLDHAAGFVHAINAAAFSANSIFLEEPQEILRLDFNAQGQTTSYSILNLIAAQALTLSALVEHLGISEPKGRAALEKLCEYQIVQRQINLAEHKANFRGARYAIADFFLNFYFAVLKKYENSIRFNKKGLLFPALCLHPPTSMHILGFTGKAFERLFAYVLKEPGGNQYPLHRKLQLLDYDHSLHTYCRKPSPDEPGNEVDLVVKHRTDRILRVCECKWTDREQLSMIEEIRAKTVPLEKNETRKNVLVVSFTPSTKFLREAARQKVTIITLEDLI